KYFRVPVDFPVTVTIDENQDFVGVATNISDGGMAVRLPHVLPGGRSVSIRFALPGSTTRLNAKVSIAWMDAGGSVGVRFEFMPPGARQELNAWLMRNIDLPKKQVIGTTPQSLVSKSLR
ncbi:MAG: PilZ domain-containing protein, partial [Candidatus Korobacteraceae bacterium]